MRDPESTKKRILEESARLFNIQGYKATSISDITAASGLTKGAIYRHFQDKEDLEKKTFSHLAKEVVTRFTKAVKSQDNAPDKLAAICSFYEEHLNGVFIEGGCPMLNAAIESDDTKEGLKNEVLSLKDMLQTGLRTILEKGIKYGQIKPETDVVHYSIVFIAMLEGGIMMSKLSGNSKDMKAVVQQLHRIIKEISL
jgi:TetR/AcrR family transcriptional regulator, transcriptional repressor for nem operon